MKKQIRNQFSNGIRKTIFRISLASFVFVGIIPGFANAQGKYDSAPPASVHYVGDIDGEPVFKVTLNNASGNLYVLTIKDQEGTVFYSEKFSDKNFIKKFKFDKGDHEDVKLTFVLSSPSEKKDQVFQVNTNVQVLKDVVVTRL